MNTNDRYEAWITIPRLTEDSYELVKRTDDLAEARAWLAKRMARHPESSDYGIWDSLQMRFITINEKEEACR